jgi:glucose-6-phosphate isomerase
MIEFDFSPADAFIDSHVGSGLFLRAHAAHRALLEGTGAGSEWLGWRRILQDPNDALLEEITSVSREIRERADVLICIGIGGSYLGAKAIISALSPYFSSEPDGEEGVHAAPRVIFAGHHLSGSYLQELLDSLEGKSVFANVISKSGSTLEPAIAFRIIRKWMEDRFDDCSRRIIVTTDPDGGSLRELAQTNDYRTFDIPADIGGRFSALTPAGLFPVAVAGFDIRSLFYGSVAMMTELLSPEDNPAVAYAMSRYALHESGYTAEILSVFEPKLGGLGSWWQQLFAESEGKDLKGLFPTTCTYSGDLHSL